MFYLLKGEYKCILRLGSSAHHGLGVSDYAGSRFEGLETGLVKGNAIPTERAVVPENNALIVRPHISIVPMHAGGWWPVGVLVPCLCPCPCPWWRYDTRWAVVAVCGGCSGSGGDGVTFGSGGGASADGAGAGAGGVTLSVVSHPVAEDENVAALFWTHGA